MSAKNMEKAEEYRKIGNDEFKKRNLIDALSKYNESILHAPCLSGQLAIAYGNRSAVFFEQKRFQECLRDVERSLSNVCCPESIKFKLQQRSSKCSIEINKFAEKCAKNVDNPVPKIPDVCESIPAMSSACELKYNDEEGRHLIARRDIEAGEVLIVENPYAFVPLPHCSDIFCHNCCRKMPPDFVPCDSCVDVKFCSEKCRDEAQVYHSFECGDVSVLFNTGLAHLALRMFTFSDIPSVFTYLCYCEKTGDKEGKFGLDADERFILSYETVYNLVTNRKKMKADDLAVYAKTGFKLYKRLVDKGFLDSIVSACQNRPEICARCKEAQVIRVHVMSIIVRHIQQLICNAHTINCIDRSVSYEDPDSSTYQQKIATGVFPTVSLMNHACEPNTFSSFRGKTLIVRATKDIERGEQIFNCYGPRVGRMPLDIRRSSLSEQYFFECQCWCCVSVEEREKEKLLTSLACSTCGAPLAGSNDEEMFYCNRCSTNFPQQAILGKKLEQHFLSAVKEENFTKVEKMLTDLEKTLFVHNKRLLELRDLAAKCFAESGLLELSTKTLIRNLDSFAFIYGEYSIEVGDEVFWLVDLLLSMKENQIVYRELKQLLSTWIEKAIRIFSLHYGADCWQVEEIKKAVNED